LYLEGELDMLLDQSWVKSGLEQLQTSTSLAATVRRLAAAGTNEYAQVSALESCWYMRNQLLRDTDWSSMAHGLEVRVPFVDVNLLERVGPAVASANPPSKIDLAQCVGSIADEVVKRRKTGFVTPVRSWTGQQSGRSFRGLRGWAAQVHRNFRDLQQNGTVAA
jgi:asparagine synthase (glutamine-hydrolysing)